MRVNPQNPLNRLVHPSTRINGRGEPESKFDQAVADLVAEQQQPSNVVPIRPELSAAERIAEHTGHPQYVIADEIADVLVAHGHKITSGERLLIAGICGRWFADGAAL